MDRLKEFEVPSGFELRSIDLNADGSWKSARYWTNETGYVIGEGSRVCHIVGQAMRYLDRWYHSSLCGEQWGIREDGEEIRPIGFSRQKYIRVEKIPPTKRICGSCLRTRRARGLGEWDE
jgi:hypothetical protein